jgi:hypothetical protein
MAEAAFPELLDRKLNGIKPDDKPLPDILAAADKLIEEKINEEYEAARHDMHSALKHAVQCGDYLNQAKAQCEASKLSWDKWLKAKTKLPQTTASLYMRLATYRAEISKGLANDPKLSITKAITLLPKAAPRGATKDGGSSKQGSVKSTAPLDLTSVIKDQNIAPDEIVTAAKQAGSDLVETGRKVIDQLNDEASLTELAKYIAAKLKAVKGIK